jgi:hypothetical protein
MSRMFLPLNLVPVVNKSLGVDSFDAAEEWQSGYGLGHENLFVVHFPGSQRRIQKTSQTTNVVSLIYVEISCRNQEDLRPKNDVIQGNH